MDAASKYSAETVSGGYRWKCKPTQTGKIKKRKNYSAQGIVFINHPRNNLDVLSIFLHGTQDDIYNEMFLHFQ